MTNITKDQIYQYLESKKNAWAPSTFRSEKLRLNTIYRTLVDASDDPMEFYNIMISKFKPYTTKTSFIRTCELMEFLGNNTFTEFMEKNSNLFKHVYYNKQLTYTFEEAQKRVEMIRHEGARQVARLMLTTGMRIHEALKYDGSGRVRGKGGKVRPIFSKERVTIFVSEPTVRLYCKEVGVNPHDLRKLAATQLAKAGFAEADLLYTMGWESMATAGRYLQPLKQDELAKKVKGVLQNAILK